MALPFVPALLWATVLSILLHPLYRRLNAKLCRLQKVREEWCKSIAALGITLLALVLICIPFFLVGVGIYSQVTEVASRLGTQADGTHALTVDNVLKEIDAMLLPLTERLGTNDISLSEYVRENAKEIAETLRQPLGRAARGIGIAIVTMVIALLTMFFLLRDSERLKQPTIDLLPLPKEKTEALLARISETVNAVFVGTVLVAIIQGVIMGIAFAIAGVPNALLLGVFSVILCIIPLLGAPILYVPAGLLLLSHGDISGALIVLLVGFLVVSQIDNLIKPYFIGGRLNLHPMAVFFSVLGGVLIFGAVGVMAGPIVLTVVLALQDVVREQVAVPEGN